jgi:hypothetical protein
MMRRLAAGLVVTIVSAGCPRGVPLESPQLVVVHDAPPEEANDAPLIGVLDGVGMTLLLPRERQQEEIVALNDALASTDLASDRMQLALLLTLGDPAVRDAERARALLEGRTFDDAGSETLARVVLELVEERDAHARDRLALEQERRLRREFEHRIEAMKAIDTEIDARDLEAETGDASQAEDPVR